MLDDSGLSNVRQSLRNVDCTWLKLAAERNLKDQWIPNWHSELQDNSSCSTYTWYKGKYECERYLQQEKSLHIYFTKFRTNNNKLQMVTCRCSNTLSENWKCTLCNLDVLADENHIMLNVIMSKVWNRGKITFHNIIYKDPACINTVNLSSLKK